MNSVRPVVVIRKVFVTSSTISDLERYFQCNWKVLQKEVEDFFATLPSPTERMASFVAQLEMNRQKKYDSVER